MEDWAVLVVVGVAYWALVLLIAAIRLRSFDRRRPQCSNEFGGLRCQRADGHVVKHYHKTGVSSDDAVTWPTGYISRG